MPILPQNTNNMRTLFVNTKFLLLMLPEEIHPVKPNGIINPVDEIVRISILGSRIHGFIHIAGGEL